MCKKTWKLYITGLRDEDVRQVSSPQRRSVFSEKFFIIKDHISDNIIRDSLLSTSIVCPLCTHPLGVDIWQW